MPLAELVNRNSPNAVSVWTERDSQVTNRDKKPSSNQKLRFQASTVIRNFGFPNSNPGQGARTSTTHYLTVQYSTILLQTEMGRPPVRSGQKRRSPTPVVVILTGYVLHLFDFDPRTKIGKVALSDSMGSDTSCAHYAAENVTWIVLKQEP